MKAKLILPTRIVIFLLFIVSGVAKMFPIWAFEKQLVDLDIASWCSAPYLARFIIAIEIAIGIAILQNHYLKKIVIPATILLLLIFCGHLSVEMYKHGAMNGNCGCFGQLIPMTPLEAFIKNIITIGLLIFLYKNVSEKDAHENKSIYLIIIYLASALLLFVCFPFCPCSDKVVEKDAPIIPQNMEVEKIEEIIQPQIDTIKTTKVNKDEKVIEKVEKVVVEGPKKTVSKFAKYTNFSGKMINVDEGKKIVCLFVPGCDHCRDAAKALGKMAKKPGFPEVAILFMDEETELIPEFFKVTQTAFPYKILGIPEFWQVIGNDTNTPGVVYLWNGNIVKFYEGTESNKFEAEDLKKILEKK